MSQLKVDTITDEAGTGSPSLPNGLTVGGVNYPSTGPLSNRNKIINGAMVIDQRNAGAVVTAKGSFLADRFQISNSGGEDVTFNLQQVSEAPAGFKNSIKVTITSPETTIGADERIEVRQRIEGNNVADLNYGTADAVTTTLSFWVRSSLTGAFGGSYLNGASNRSYPFSYTINAANTWEYKTVTVEGDTTGTWAKDNSSGLVVNWALGAGSNRVGTAGAWNSNFNFGVTGQVQLISTNGATWQITGVQLEAGTVATPFEHRSFGQELALCQRYYEKSQATFYGPSGSNNYFPVTFLVNKRTAPSVSIVGLGSITGATAGTTAPIVDSGGAMFYMANTGIVGGAWTASAEL
jgi:hypothetical protein